MDIEKTFTELYREIILTRSKSTDMRGTVEGCNLTAKGHNSYCGDILQMGLRVEDEVIEEARFQGDGCAIFLAAASILAEMLAGKTLEEADTLIRTFTRYVNGERRDIDEEALEALVAFSEVHRFPVRVRCAVTPFYAVKNAIRGYKKNEDEGIYLC